METRKLGRLEVGAIGLGEMPLSIDGRPDEDRAIAPSTPPWTRV